MRMTYRTILFGIASTVVATMAQEAPISPWRVSLGYRVGLNYEVEIRNRGMTPAANNPSLNGRSYADGFVGTDTSGNAMGLTSYWGYQRANQVVCDSLAFRHSESGRIEEESPVSHGFEVVLARQLGGSESFRWGVEGGFGFTVLSSDGTDGISAGLSGLDVFPLGGIIPPQPPYAGPQTPAIGAPLLGTASATIPLRLRSDIDASIYHFRVGPYIEFPIRERFSLGASAGLALDLVDSSIEMGEMAPAPYAAFSRTYRDDTLKAALGGYLNVMARYYLSEQWSLMGGAQVQVMEKVRHHVGDKAVNFGSGGTVYLVFGAGYDF